MRAYGSNVALPLQFIFFCIMVLAFATTLLNPATALQALEADNILYSATINSLILDRSSSFSLRKAPVAKFFRGGDVVPNES
jgi:hypothetical protein